MSRADFVSYSCFDAQGTWLLWQQLRAHLESLEWQQGHDLFHFYNLYWKPFGEQLTDMERAGIHVDVATKLPEAQRLAEAERTRLELLFRRPRGMGLGLGIGIGLGLGLGLGLG